MPAVNSASILHHVPIALGDRSYPIRIGTGLLDDVAVWSEAPSAAQALIVTNSTVGPLYAARLERAIWARHASVHLLTLPDGEQHKNWQTLNLVFDSLLQHG